MRKIRISQYKQKCLQQLLVAGATAHTAAGRYLSDVMQPVAKLSGTIT